MRSRKGTMGSLVIGEVQLEQSHALYPELAGAGAHGVYVYICIYMYIDRYKHIYICIYMYLETRIKTLTPLL